MYWFLVNRRMTVHSHTMFACKPVNLVLRHRNLYPYANAGIDLSGKANPFDTRFHSHLLGEPEEARTPDPQIKSLLRYQLRHWLVLSALRLVYASTFFHR